MWIFIVYKKSDLSFIEIYYCEESARELVRRLGSDYNYVALNLNYLTERYGGLSECNSNG